MHAIADEEAHEIPLARPRRVRDDLIVRIDPHAIQRARELLDDHAFELVRGPGLHTRARDGYPSQDG
jgi:hypothetical protein